MRLKYQLKFNDGDTIETGNLAKFFRLLFDSNPVIRNRCPLGTTAEQYAKNRICVFYAMNSIYRKRQKGARETYYLFDLKIIPYESTYTVQIQLVHGLKKDHKLSVLTEKRLVNGVIR